MSEHRTAAPPGIRVTTTRHAVPHCPPMSGYGALAERFGSDRVYLLESAAGPERDRRYRFLGFDSVLSVSVTADRVRITGAEPVRAEIVRRIRGFVTPADHPPPDGTPAEWRLREPRDMWALLREVRGAFAARGSSSRFRFGFLAHFGYDTARYIERLPHLIERRPGPPDIHLVLHRGCLVTDLAEGSTELLLHHSDHWDAPGGGPPRGEAGEIIRLLADAERSHPEPAAETVPEATVDDDTDAATFRRDVDRCLRHISIGDIYQVQIGHELTMRSSVDPVDVYRRLRRRNPSPYMYLAGLEGHTVIGASPELFVRVEDGEVTMRPIAGTVPRPRPDTTGGTDPRTAESAAAHRLAEDPKEVAEHTMLVDLCRNDIGRISRPDTLEVPDQLAVERYSHVLHLVSTVHGRLEPGFDSFDTIAALFPAGTMTGTPKIRAMEIIEEVERSRRGLYAGALGLIDVGGYLNLALCIRTLFHHDGAYRTRASAGVVADSVPDREWTETLAKMSACHWAVTGKELL